MITSYTPQIEDLWFKESMLSDPETMSYNHAWGGTIPFPKGVFQPLRQLPRCFIGLRLWDR